MIQAGGDILTSEMHKICNQAWHEGKAPTDNLDCNAHRTISLLSHASKVLMMVLLERLKAQVEPHLSEQWGLKRQWAYDKGIQYLQRYSYLSLKELWM